MQILAKKKTKSSIIFTMKKHKKAPLKSGAKISSDNFLFFVAADKVFV